MQANNPTHGISTYLLFAAAWNQQHLVRPVSAPAPAPAEPQANQQPRALTDAEIAQRKAIIRQVEIQDALPNALNEGWGFQAMHQGQTWFVTLNGNQVAIGPTKKKAQGMARVGNDLLRRLGKQAVVDPTTLEAQFQFFVDSAANGGQGTGVTINPTFPT
jgi:hypothetical protein